MATIAATTGYESARRPTSSCAGSNATSTTSRTKRVVTSQPSTLHSSRDGVRTDNGASCYTQVLATAQHRDPHEEHRLPAEMPATDDPPRDE
eukprot:7098833-Pyramimonas_sp.AAC.1